MTGQILVNGIRWGECFDGAGHSVALTNDELMNRTAKGCVKCGAVC